MSIGKDFNEFAMKGNVVDLAVAVIIGGAFGKIITSLVSDVIMPLIGLVVGGVNFVDLKWEIKAAEMIDGVEKAAVTMNYGNFMQVTFDFIVIAFSIFMVIKLMSNLKKKEVAPTPAPEAPAAPSKEEVLLSEIRDLLKEGSKK
jgi:large conductance mechanosensitive channel